MKPTVFTLGCCLKIWFLSSVVVLGIPLANATSREDLAAMVSPPKMVASDLCSAFAEATLAPRLLDRLSVDGSGSAFTPPMALPRVKFILQNFDNIVSDFCGDIDSVVGKQAARVTAVFAKNYAVQVSAEWDDALSNQKIRKWNSSEIEFQNKVRLWPAIWKISLALNPQSVGPELRRPLMEFMLENKDESSRDWRVFTMGNSFMGYRKLISVMVADPVFKQIAPQRYDFNELKRAEFESRTVGIQILKPLHSTIYPSLESTRLRVLSDMQQNLGLEEAYKRAIARLSKIQ